MPPYEFVQKRTNPSLPSTGRWRACEPEGVPPFKRNVTFPRTRVVVGAPPYEYVRRARSFEVMPKASLLLTRGTKAAHKPSLLQRVAKRREGLKKQHSVLFFPERDRAAVRPPVPTRLVWFWDGCKTKAFPSGEGGRKKPSAFSRWMRRPKSAHTNAFLPSPS